METADRISAFYHPELPRASARTRNIVARIQRFCLQQKYVEGKIFISKLDPGESQDLVIAIYIAILHLQHGNYAGAESVLESINLDKLLQGTNALLREELALLALLAAQARISTNFRLDEAVSLANEVDHIYMTRTWEMEEDFSNDEERVFVERIIQQRRFWDGSRDDLSSEVMLSDVRIMIEDNLCSIMKTALDSGLVRSGYFRLRIRNRITPLASYLRAHNRRLAEAPFIFHYLSKLPTETTQLDGFWKDYLRTLESPDLRLLKGSALSFIAEFTAPVNMEAAQSYCEEAFAFFDAEGCQSRITDLALQRWRFASRDKISNEQEPESYQSTMIKSTGSADSMQTTTNVVPIHKSNELIVVAQNRLVDLLAIHEQYLEQHMSLRLENTVSLAVKLSAENPMLWSKTKNFMDSAISQMVAFRNEMGVRKLQSTFFLKAAERLEFAEEARDFFETLTNSADKLSPFDYISACRGTWISYTELDDHVKALAFAMMDFEAPMCTRSESNKSAAAYRIARSRLGIVDARNRYIPVNFSTSKALCNELEEIATFLETWIKLDKKSGRWNAVREKNVQLTSVFQSLHTLLGTKDSEMRLQGQVTKVHDENELENEPPRKVDLTLAFLMLTQRRIEEGMDYTAREYNQVVKNRNSTLINKAIAATGAATMLAASVLIEPPLPVETRKTIRLQQWEYLTSDLGALELAYQEGFLIRSVLLADSAIEQLKLWPEKRDFLMQFMDEYFNKAQEMCYNIRRTLFSDRSLVRWIRSRTLGAKFLLRLICQVAAGFYLKTDCHAVAWNWIQRGRAQVLQEMLTERATARQRILLTLESEDNIAAELAKEKLLVGQLQNCGSVHYFRARRQLEKHRERMNKVHILGEIVNGPKLMHSMQLSEINDIWALKSYLPESSNILLVDWFIDTHGVIWRLDVNYRERDRPPHWTKGYIKLSQISKWKEDYLKFSAGRMSPLERKWTALRELRNLLHGLEKRCAPEDLLVISTPGELSNIPIHGIPFNGDPGVPMIERNPVVYSGGLNLLRTCLVRAHNHRVAGTASLLKDAYFMSAYEADGYEAERAEIFTHLEKVADSFGSNTLLGTDLTMASIKKALNITSWVHYHGHAYYAKTEALNQCLVLGRLKEEERDVQSRMEAMSLEDTKRRIQEAMPFEKPLSDKEAVLASHLLEGSSRLSVADVFAMDLSETSPVVINIACDSGVQEFSGGDDPLGLVAALFCAGASSVVGTLWPISSSAGRLFSEHFYRSLAKQDEDFSNISTVNSQRVVNLAFALRAAILAIKRVKPAPYFWAAFVLQGAPVYLYDVRDVPGGKI